MRLLCIGATQNHLGLVGLNYIVEKCFVVCETLEKRDGWDGRGNALESLGRVNSQVVFELQCSSSSLVGLFLIHKLCCEGRGVARAASFSPGTVLV